jgi:hypothetical protein
MAFSDLSWGTRRQVLIVGLLAGVGLVLFSGVFAAVVYKAPSCSDQVQNQDEHGVDCGGPCPYLCLADETPPTVTFSRAVSPEPNRTDVIAYIDNSNPTAYVSDAPFTLELYGPKGDLVYQGSGTISIPPGMTVPLFLPGAYIGSRPVSRAFVSFDPGFLKWQTAVARPFFPTPSAIQISNGLTPKVTATLLNATALPVYDEKVVATVFDAQNNAIGASKTVVPTLPAQGSAPVVFTWNQPFSAIPARVEILPVPSL